MVFFTCNACNESMKKNQVEKHLYQCRRCEYLSCVDCSQEFWGNDYAKHIKCISEDAKYGGMDYKPKPNANKGERKQEAWTEQVQRAIDKSQTNMKLKKELERLKPYSNIPRKKAKFENFVKNSLRIPASMAAQLWNAISAELAQNNTQPNTDNKISETELNAPTEENCTNGLEESETKSNQNGDSTTENVKKLSKREKKLERRNEQHKEEKKEKKKKKKNKENIDNDTEQSEINTELCDVKDKKKKKRTFDEISKDNEEASTETVPNKKKKSKKNKSSDVSSPTKLKTKKEEAEQNGLNESIVESKKEKFSWENVITAVLKKAEDNKMSIKKLRKKVLSQYASHHEDSPYTEDRILAKFNKKINKNPMFKVHKEKVTLKT